MKKFYSLFFALISVMLLKAQGGETFETQAVLTATYGAGTFSGETAGVTVNFAQSRDQGTGSENYSITGKGIMIRRASDSYLEFVIPNGVGTFKFKYRKAFTSNAARQLEVLVDGVGVYTTAAFGTLTGAETTVYTTPDIAVNKSTSTTIRIKNVGTTETNRQITIDDFSWTLPSSDPALSVSTSNINFGEVFIPNTSSPSTVTVSASNLSVAPTYTITGTDAAMFSATGTLTTSGGSLDVTFSPTSVGAKSATLTITSGSANATVALTGVGVSADNPFSLDETSPVSALVENFETGVLNSTTMPNSWKNVNEATADRKWEIRTYNSNKYAQMSANNGTGAYSTWLVSPAINLDQINKTSVKFDWNSGYANGAQLKVYVLKLNSGVMVKNLVTTINDNVNTTGYGAAYSTETLDLSAYSGIGFLAFEYVGDSAIPATTTYQLDNINITSFLGVKDVIKSKNVFLKNTIVNDALSFETKGNATVKLYNSNGQLVKSFNITPNNKTINVSSLQKGVYIVSSELNDGETVSQKIVKQ